MVDCICLLFVLLRQGKIGEFIVSFVALFCVLFPTIIVADVARSTAYAFPVLIISIVRLRQLCEVPLASMRRALLLVLALNYATPAGFSFGGISSELYFYYPLPIRIWRWAIFPGGMDAFYWRLG